MRASMALMAVLSRPTSVSGTMSVRRWLKSPAAMSIAVVSTWRRLRKASVTSHLVSRAVAMRMSSATNA